MQAVCVGYGSFFFFVLSHFLFHNAILVLNCGTECFLFLPAA